MASKLIHKSLADTSDLWVGIVGKIDFQIKIELNFETLKSVISVSNLIGIYGKYTTPSKIGILISVLLSLLILV